MRLAKKPSLKLQMSVNAHDKKPQSVCQILYIKQQQLLTISPFLLYTPRTILIFNLRIIFIHLIHGNNQTIKTPILGINKARNGSINHSIVSGWGVNDQNIVTFRCNVNFFHHLQL